MTIGMDRRIERPVWRRRPVLIAGGAAGLLVVAVTAVILLAGTAAGVRVPVATVTVDAAQSEVFHDFVPLKGKALPKDEVYLDALDGGQVAEVLARSGDQVAAGQPLVKFRNTALELDVLDREGRLVESITQLQTFEKQLEETRVANAKTAAEIDYNVLRLSREAQRRDVLLARGFFPREQADQLHDELNYQQRLLPMQDDSNRRQEGLRQAQLPQIEAEMATLRESLAVTRSKLDSLVLKAPVAGKLTENDLQVGQILKPGDRLGEVVPGTGFKAQADIDEYYLGRVAIGQNADVDGRRQELRHAGHARRSAGEGRSLPGRAGVQRRGCRGSAAWRGAGGQAGGGRRPAGAGAAGRAIPGAHGRRLGHGGLRGRRPRRAPADPPWGPQLDQVEVLSGLKPGERVITSDYAAFEKVDRVDLTK